MLGVPKYTVNRRPLEPPSSSSMKNPQSATRSMGLRKPHPPSRGGVARARLKQDGELAPIASNGPRLGGSTHGYTPPGVHRTRELPVMRVRPRPAGTSPMPVETNAPHTGQKLAKKPLQERPRSCRASGARPAGPLTRPHGTTLATRREERPISRLQHLRDPNGNTQRCSGATVWDSPKGPLNNRGETRLKPAKNTKHKSTCTPNTHTQHKHNLGGPRGPLGQHSECPSSGTRLARGIDAPSGEVRLARGPYTPLGRGPSRSRAQSRPSNEVRLARGLSAPSGRARSARGHPRAPFPRPHAHLLPHARTGI
jgi:hypothetical protein